MRGLQGSKRWGIYLRQNKMWLRKLIKETIHNSAFSFFWCLIYGISRNAMGWVWWHMLVIQSLKVKAGRPLWVCALPVLNREFQDNLNYIQKPCLKMRERERRDIFIIRTWRSARLLPRPSDLAGYSNGPSLSVEKAIDPVMWVPTSVAMLSFPVKLWESKGGWREERFLL